MQHHDNWSVSVGRWMGVPIRVHLCMILFLVLIFAVEWHFARLPAAMGGFPPGTGAVMAISVFVAVILHELAHIFATINLGGLVRKIVLTPWGGQSEYSLPNSAPAQSIVYSAGIFANGMIFLLLASVLVQLEKASLLQLINPIQPHRLGGVSEVAILKIFCWVNFQIAVINLLPAFPFDGSQLLRLFIWGNNRHVGRHRLETTVMAVAFMVAVSFLVLAWFARNSDLGPIQPIWAVLASFGVILMFAAHAEFYRRTSMSERAAAVSMMEEEMIDFEAIYDDESNLFEFDQDPNETISQWLRQKQEERQMVEFEIEQEDEVRADYILEKLHHSGKESLTDEERTVLQRVSDRYRRRRRQLPS